MEVITLAGEKWAYGLTDAWKKVAAKAIAERGEFNVALSGGKTPAPFYRMLAHSDGIPWDQTHVYLSDERNVPLNHAESNFGQAHSLLLQYVHIPSDHAHPWRTDLEPKAAAVQYAEVLNRIPNAVLDLVILGMGEDGHTASLFPDSPLIQETDAITGAQFVDGKGWRLSFTFPMINRAREVWLVIHGQNKLDLFDAYVQNPKVVIASIKPTSGDFKVYAGV
ncbi:MAG: 6-phosphogluconolactonase [Verrucomicrobiota bacterium]|nr:6-phosphogluconolactonase [Verrucomicrobiota bacterium]